MDSPGKRENGTPRPDDDPPETYRERMIVNAVAVVFLLLLVGAGLWIVNSMADMRAIQDCVGSGRRNCAPIQTPAR